VEVGSQLNGSTTPNLFSKQIFHFCQKIFFFQAEKIKYLMWMRFIHNLGKIIFINNNKSVYDFSLKLIHLYSIMKRDVTSQMAINTGIKRNLFLVTDCRKYLYNLPK